MLVILYNFKLGFHGNLISSFYMNEFT